jgi:ribonuclease VapC
VSPVNATLNRSAISAVNWSEVAQKTAARGLSLAEVKLQFLAVGLRVYPFTVEDAEATAVLWQRAPNLSLADRACLALASRLGVPALTADRIWATLQLGIEVQIIRA